MLLFEETNVFDLHHTNILYDSKAVFREGIMELRVGSKYRLGRKIGSGSFGDIYLGKMIIYMI